MSQAPRSRAGEDHPSVTPEEALATLLAISRGEVDAFIVHRGEEELVLVLDGVDRPYRLLIEQMNQGALTVAPDGTIAYCNRRFAQLMGETPGDLVGRSAESLVAQADRPHLLDLLHQAEHGDAEREVSLLRADQALVPAAW